MNKVYYMSYRHLDGRRYKRTGVLRRMCQLREHGSRLERSMSGGNIVTGAEFLQLVWNIFPKKMQNWLTNNQKIGRFNPNNPLDADKFCDNLHHYWSMKFKGKKVTKEKNKTRTRETIRVNRTARRRPRR